MCPTVQTYTNEFNQSCTKKWSQISYEQRIQIKSKQIGTNLETVEMHAQK